MKCKHENADHLMPGDIVDEGWPHWPVDFIAKCEQLRCLDCEEWLPLDPANDNDDRVKTEIRAAEIAANLADGGCEMTALECCGFNDEPMLLRGGAKVLLSSTSTDAGYLANRIAEHEDTP